LIEEGKMAETLEYAREVRPRRSKLLVSFANVALIYPLTLASGFYVDWLAAWYLLGHKPRPTLDDPKQIAGLAGVETAFGFFLLAMSLATCLGFVVTGVYGVKGQFRVRELVERLILFVVFWVGTCALLVVDPGGVLYWWLD
jgi:hypothetical protein